ncbi:hypothetical protein XACM_1330 [Xanthomonas euvesicatoria pv. citrumelo F1]|nr:hypothetical protein XACM_1330 [Xanthomonas euvesicatoria pv. citrumelo F1]
MVIVSILVVRLGNALLRAPDMMTATRRVSSARAFSFAKSPLKIIKSIR